MIRYYLIAVCYSIAIHVFVVLLLLTYSKSNTIQRISYQHLVQAYVVNQPYIIFKHEFHKYRQLALLKSPKHVIPAKTTIHGLEIKSTMTYEHIGKNEHLLIILHNQIQHQIDESVYNLPKTLDSRSLLIQFLLTPQGTLNSVNVIKSSGIKILDNLAIKAVTSIQPFHIAKKYLVTDTYFRIKFYFE